MLLTPDNTVMGPVPILVKYRYKLNKCGFLVQNTDYRKFNLKLMLFIADLYICF